MLPCGRAETPSEYMSRVSLALRSHLLRRLSAFANAHTLSYDELDQFEMCGRYYMRLIKESGLSCTDATVYMAMGLPADLKRNKDVFTLPSGRMLAGGSLFSCQGGEHMNYVAKILILVTTNLHDGFLVVYCQTRQRHSVVSEQGVPEWSGAATYKAHSKPRFERCTKEGYCTCGAELGSPLGEMRGEIAEPPEWLNFGSCISCKEKLGVFADCCETSGAVSGKCAEVLCDENSNAQRRQMMHNFDVDLLANAARLEDAEKMDRAQVEELACPLSSMGGHAVESPISTDEGPTMTPEDKMVLAAGAAGASDSEDADLYALLGLNDILSSPPSS